MRAAIVDTGPLVAFLDRAERHHHWVVERIEELDPPLLVCEPVLAETMHLLARFPRELDALSAFLKMARSRSHSALMSISLPCGSCIRR
jgi:predicted nucleic acid-binding protein